MYEKPILPLTRMQIAVVVANPLDNILTSKIKICRVEGLENTNRKIAERILKL